jgi:hypothetical protein
VDPVTRKALLQVALATMVSAYGESRQELTIAQFKGDAAAVVKFDRQSIRRYTAVLRLAAALARV